MNESPNAQIEWPRPLLGVLAVLAMTGAVAFIVGATGGAAQRAWQIYLVNYVFWTGIAVAGVVLTAIWHITSSIWGKAYQGLAVAGAGFFPAALVLFLPLTLAGATLFPWVERTTPHREVWLDPTFVFARNGLALAALFALAWAFVRLRLRAASPASGGASEETQRRLSRLAPVLCVVYALVLSLVAFDLIMPLDPHFISTLFGGYYFFGSLYAGLAWLAVLAVLLLRGEATRGLLAPRFLHPMGKLLFGFCMFHGMLFFSQYLPIWYGNLPEETEFVVRRSHEAPWPWFSLALLMLSLLLPFVILISRPVKIHPRGLAAAAGIVLVGMWLDKYLLIVPSIWHQHEAPLGLLELAVTAGFASLMLLSYWAFSRRFPLVHYSAADIQSPTH
ncbi:MAG: hypothetical protein ACRD4U_00830 [Candidatus Acidiferrales bacterium]